MRKLLTLFTSLSLISSSSISVISCSDTPRIYDVCFDEYGNNVTDEGSDIKQWLDITWIMLFLAILPKEFPESESFKDLNNKTSSELVKTYFRDPQGEEWLHDFAYDFTFLLRTYDSINSDVIFKMQEDLKEVPVGIYLFLNLPEINIENIKTATNIDFQLIFITKNSDGSIIGNSNNSWFYWYDQKIKNEPNDNQKYFFNFIESILESKHVVTNYLQLH